MPPFEPNALRRCVVAALTTILVVCCRPAAALDDAARCLHDKMHADRAATARYLFCSRFDAAEGDRRQRCLDRAETRLRGRLAAADARALVGGFRCPAGAEALGLVGPAAWPLRFVEAAAGAESADCVRRKARAARRYVSGYGRCLEDHLLRGGESDGEVEACARTARERLLADWQDTAAEAACAADGAEEAAGVVEKEIAESASRLMVKCGDRVIAGVEECDDGGSEDGDGCSADCRTETCGRIDGGEVRCVACPPDSVPTEDFDGCRCDDGFDGVPGSCTDVDECADGNGVCGENRPCVNLSGSWACAIPCTADAFHQAIAQCGAPSGAIAFDCSDTVIAIPGGAPGVPREVTCDGLVVDGAGRGITFELDPLCWRTPLDPAQCPGGLEEDGTCRCPDVDSGDVFLRLRGDGNVVRDLTVRGFFDGIPARGRGNLVENVRFERMCDDAFGSVLEGAGNTFRHLVVRDGCDKCSENGGLTQHTDPDPRLATHYNAILSDIDFEGCLAPVRMASSGRFLLRDVRMSAGDDAEFPCDGPRFSSASEASRVAVRIERSTIEGCRRGVRFGRGADGLVLDSRIAGCGLRGLRVASTARVSVEGTTIEANGGNGSSESGFGGAAVVGDAALDLGGGELEIDGVTVRSSGQNSLCANAGPDGAGLEVDNAAMSGVAAAGNWWCTADSPADRISGAAATDPVLDRAPLRVRTGSD